MFNYLFGFQGRMGRSGWWLGQVLLFTFAVAWIYSTGIMNFDASSEVAESFPLSVLIMGWFYCYSWMAITVKRLHDRGLNGWWAVPGFAPTLLYTTLLYIYPDATYDMDMMSIISIAKLVQHGSGIVYLGLCGTAAGDKGDNAYGPPPGGVSVSDEKRPVATQMNAAPSNGLGKLDDDYFKKYAQNLAQNQPSAPVVQTASASAPRPSFGRR
jgi:uncharacterized membrane protein YhaH (DUF805 family)